MKKLILTAAAAALLGLAHGAAPASAAPVGPAQIAAPDSAVAQVRMSRRSMHRQIMKNRRMIRKNRRMIRRNRMR